MITSEGLLKTLLHLVCLLFGQLKRFLLLLYLEDEPLVNFFHALMKKPIVWVVADRRSGLQNSNRCRLQQICKHFKEARVNHFLASTVRGVAIADSCNYSEYPVDGVNVQRNQVLVRMLVNYLLVDGSLVIRSIEVCFCDKHPRWRVTQVIFLSQPGIILAILWAKLYPNASQNMHPKDAF